MANMQNLTNPKDILKDTQNYIDGLKYAKTEMAAAAIEFTNTYDKYYFSAKRDGMLLKEKMKLAVIKGLNQDDNV